MTVGVRVKKWQVVVWRKLLGRLMVRKKRATSQEERQPEGEALRARTEV